MEGDKDMKETWDFPRCVSVLSAEIELLKKISAAQSKVRQVVMNREWADFDEKTAELNRLGEEFEVLEDDRERLFSTLRGNSPVAGKEEKPFTVMINGLPMDECRELSRLYRELKMECLRIQAINKTFLVYLTEAKTMAAAYLEAICPERGGKLYTRKGHIAAHDMRSIVFNNSF